MPGILKRLLPIRFGSQRCPDCDEMITSEVINIKEGVALCPQCGKLSRLSELNLSGVSVAEILAHPPAGCSVISDGQRVTATVSLRSLTGFWIIRRKKRFDAREVKTVEFGTTAWQSESGANKLIEITADRSVKFGSLLQSDRMSWLRAVLREILVTGNSHA